MREAAIRPVALVASDPTTLELLVEALVRAGLSVVPARSVPGARLEVEARDLDLVVIDLTVFGPGGLGFLRWLRERPDKASVPVLVLTARDRPDQMAAGLRAGATAYTTKPVELPVLEACAEALLRQASILRAARREGEILAELAEVEARLARTAEREAALSRRGSAGSDGGTPTTGEIPAARTGEGRAGRSGGGRAAQPRDTAELVSVDWVLFQAVEGALARCMESRRPLSVLVMEAQALDPLGPGQAGPFLEAFARRVAGLLGEAGTLKAIAGRTFCAVLPEVDASLVRDVSERIMAGLAAGPLSASDGEWRASASLGAASLEPDFSGSPFRLVDRAHTALAMAKEAGPTGYWVYQDTAVREDD